MRPLDGVRVLDLAQMWAAPGCAMYLADQGADVVKVEPLAGDDARHTISNPPIRDGQSRAYLAVGRNKRGMATDLRTSAGQAIIHRLIPAFDVVVVNFRPGVAERLQVDYETLRRLNRRLIYVHLTAYGWRGPYADRPGYDLVFQALSGIFDRRRMPDGTPDRCAHLGSGLLGAGDHGLQCGHGPADEGAHRRRTKGRYVAADGDRGDAVGGRG